jgi:adenine-specific DNA-methyltransferase
MPPKTTKTSTVPVSAVTHQDKRTNIPTQELRDFVADDENAPATMLYPRDPSLDPQLVWQGKDEQDRQDLSVPVVPVYIQEKINPQAIIENVRAQARQEAPDQLALFADFNHITFEDMVDFYHHEQNWTNRMILGDSLLVMASLAEKEGLKGKVQMVYMDPPYGIKFGSNWQVSTRRRDVKDGKTEDTTRQPEQIKAFRDTWQLGIHSYLAYLRDRLVVVRDLLTDTGSIFIQIGDENLHLVRCILDEVYGPENFCGLISFQKTGSIAGNLLGSTVDYLVWYAKDKERVKYRQLYCPRAAGDPSLDRYDQVQLADGTIRRLTAQEIRTMVNPTEGRRYELTSLFSDGESLNTARNFTFRAKAYEAKAGGHWKTSPPGLQRLAFADRIEVMGTVLRYRRWVEDFPLVPLADRWESTQIGTERLYVVQTAAAVIERCMLMTTDPGDLCLDPTCGSGTTAYVAEQWGRRWITIDTSRVAIALARTRLMAAKYPYYLLADSPEGQLRERELTGQMGEVAASLPTAGDIKRGFVYKRVPHITLKSIANNEEIDAIHAKWQAQLAPLRAGLNAQLKQTWEEWQIPREADPKWLAAATELHAQWWECRRDRQREIDASIAKRADTELLYDQPYEDNKRIRVSGPFTVESLSPHRVLAADEERPCTEVEGQAGDTAGQFETMILENLKAAGVQNRIRQERLRFDRLEPYAGTYLHAVGDYSESGKTKRAAVYIGPQYGTVGPEEVKEAAKEAVQGVGFDLLIVCGFAFDPHVSEEVKRYGRLAVLPTRMNPDLAMGETLLKKTGAGNLFMVFGEPDVDIQRQQDGKLVVTVRGVDVYDPTTGEIRSNTTDDIACWFIDTDYNGESFFVRHAYFTGAEEPYDKLKRALRAEVDEAAWSALYQTTSYPFDRPQSGKIAVKVINHYGDEVLKVYGV